MIFTPTELSGVVLIDAEKNDDERGHFARTFCVDEFAVHSLPTDFPQHNVSYNRQKGTLRGLHYQVGEPAETKVVRCTRGRVFDVVVDLRADSPTFRRWIGIELSAGNGRALFIPGGCAHGFQTLADETEVFYLMGARFRPQDQRGVRWNDPELAIEWPLTPTVMSQRDATYPGF